MSLAHIARFQGVFALSFAPDELSPRKEIQYSNKCYKPVNVNHCNGLDSWWNYVSQSRCTRDAQQPSPSKVYSQVPLRLCTDVTNRVLAEKAIRLNMCCCYKTASQLLRCVCCLQGEAKAR